MQTSAFTSSGPSASVSVCWTASATARPAPRRAPTLSEAGKDGKRCCTFFNTLDGMDDVVEQMQISASASQEDYQPLPAFEQEVSYHTDFAPADELEAIKVLAEAESKAREEKRIAAISNCRYNHSWKEVVLMDENGTCMTDSTQVASVSIGRCLPRGRRHRDCPRRTQRGKSCADRRQRPGQRGGPAGRAAS